jgi:DNA polymerase-3 subunit chi
MEVGFYHLLTSPLEKVLPKLLEKIFSLGKRVVLLMESEERLNEMNTLLWTYSPGSFLPHGSTKEGFSEHQPIWLTTSLENPNHASVIVITNGVILENPEGFERCLDFFDGNDPLALQNARSRWGYYKKKDFKLTYWQQNKEGSWEKN